MALFDLKGNFKSFRIKFSFHQHSLSIFYNLLLVCLYFCLSISIICFSPPAGLSLLYFSLSLSVSFYLSLKLNVNLFLSLSVCVLNFTLPVCFSLIFLCLNATIQYIYPSQIPYSLSKHHTCLCHTIHFPPILIPYTYALHHIHLSLS